MDVNLDRLAFLPILLYLLWRAPPAQAYLVSPDMGMQIALGHQLLRGALPYVDLIFAYGPLTALTSAAALWIAPDVVGEVLVCAVGYAVSLYLVFRLVRRHTSVIEAAAAAVAGLLMLARFYKWYLWLFPLAALFMVDRALHRPHQCRRWSLFSGLAGGIGLLYRADYGIAIWTVLSCIAFGERYLARKTTRHETAEPTTVVKWGAMSVGFLLPLAVWLLVLVAIGGMQGLRAYLFSTVLGGAMLASARAAPPPLVSGVGELATRLSHAAALLVAPLTYVACLAHGVRSGASGPENLERARFEAAVGLMGLATFPQALHRVDMQHLLQTLAPLLIAVPLCGRIFVSWAREATAPKRPVRIGVAAMYAIGLVFAGYGAVRAGGRDLAPLTDDPVHKYRDLAAILAARPEHSNTRVVIEIRNRTTSEQRLLVLPSTRPSGTLFTDRQFYFLADRRISGLLDNYVPGLFDDEQMRRSNLTEIRRHAPALLISGTALDDMSPDHPFRQSQPELFAFLAERYTEVVFAAGPWVLLARPAGATVGSIETVQGLDDPADLGFLEALVYRQR